MQFHRGNITSEKVKQMKTQIVSKQNQKELVDRWRTIAKCTGCRNFREYISYIYHPGDTRVDEIRTTTCRSFFNVRLGRIFTPGAGC